MKVPGTKSPLHFTLTSFHILEYETITKMPKRKPYVETGTD
jgi:hypothetical protein